LLTQVQSLLIALAIIVLSFMFLAPRVVHPTQPTVLLNETVVLTENDYEKQYNLALNKGDQLQIQVSGNGQLVNLAAALQSSQTVTLLDQEAQTFYSFEWTVPKNGPYVFTVSSDMGATTATILITKT
jgi:hypothetical protein